MHKLKFFYFCIPAGILLLIIAACNLPGFVRGVTPPAVEENTSTPTEISEHPAGPSNTDEAETILIPADSFWMGSTDTEPLAAADELPFHQVTLDAFYFYTHEVTNEMYAKCVEAGACIPVDVLAGGPTAHSSDPAHANFPVVGVDWIMAKDYCTWAGGRLPTEAEWEYAARGTESLLYPWGAEAPACDRVNMLGCEVPPDTVEVGSYELGNSPFEVWDMAGNAWEWVHDWYAEGSYALSAAVNPLGPYSYQDVNHPLKVVRGGGLYSEPVALRTASRQAADPHRPYDDVGFRCVAMSDLVLPEDYLPVDPGHLRVPPDSLDGGGEHVGEADPDPDVFFEISRIAFECPLPDGSMPLRILYSASGPVTAAVSVDDVPFTCSTSDMIDVLECTGPTPDAYGVSPTVIVEWHFEGEGISTGGAWTVELPLTDRCEEGETTRPSISASIDCPAGGLVQPRFISSPAIVWDLVQLATMTDTYDLSCWYVSDAEAVCIAPDRSDGGQYWFNLHGTTVDGREVIVLDFRIAARADCPAEPLTTRFSSYCFEDVHPVVQIDYTPASAILESVKEGIAGWLTCIGMAPGVQVCGDLISMRGTEPPIEACFAGLGCETERVVVADCLGEPEFRFRILPVCSPDGSAAASIDYWPWDRNALVSADAGGTATLTCVELAPGRYTCFGVPGAAGDEKTINFCLADGSCYSQSITLAACSSSGGTEVEYTIDPTCYPPDAAGISLHYWPFDLPLVDVNANGAWLTCDNMGGGYYLCSGLPGAVGAEKTITFCLEGYYCMGDDIIVPACEGEVPSGEDWRIAGVGCHDETRIFFIVDTGLEWLVPGAGFTYHASDGDVDYACSVHPTIPGRLYCSGPRPGTPGELILMVQQDGTSSLLRKVWTDWPALVASIPSCAPPPPVPGPSCSDHLTPTTCVSPCYWHKIGNHCSSTPPP